MHTNFFSSRHRHCDACCRRTIKVNDEEITEYYHRAVVCHLIGFDLAVPLDVEAIRPGEGEVIAAKRLLARVFEHFFTRADSSTSWSEMRSIWKARSSSSACRMART